MNPPLPRVVAVPRLLHVASGSLREVGPLLADHAFDVGSVLVGTGPGPSRALGAQVAADLMATGVRVRLIPDLTGRLDQAAAMAAGIIEDGTTVALAVGGGRVIDTVKLAAARTGVDFVSVPTAISNDGISSPVASLVGRDGARSSHAACMPGGIVLDLAAIAGAPARSLRAGVGDLLSNLTACLDWRLAHAAGHERYDAFAAMIAESAARPVLDLEEVDSTTAQELLAHGLLLSGLAMAAAGTSRPCSGAEHLISHALDAQLGPRARLHGEQVALGTLLAAAMHDQGLLGTLQDTFLRLGLPTCPEDIGLERHELVRAMSAAPAIRSDRWTVLSERELQPGEAAELVAEAFPPARPGVALVRRAPDPVALSAATLDHHATRVSVPRYDREALAPGVLHLSVGAFHRAHQAVYLDDVAALGHREWGLVGVGLRRAHMREALAPQDGLYTVVERGAAGDSARVVGVMTRYLLAPEECEAVLSALADPRLRIVTLTLTAGGYAPESEADPRRPLTGIGFLVEGLRRRRAAGLPPFTVLSCDNLPGNGPLARAAVVGQAARQDPALAAWIDDRGAFPSSMVDRITPRTSPRDRDWVAQAFGVDDRWPVVTEPFRQWIVEDDFCAGRPPLEEVGVQLVADVQPYALMKTRLLNASHCVLGHLGGLAGFDSAAEAVREPLLREAVQQLMEREVAPGLPPVPGVDPAAYRASVLERLANPVLGDRLERLRRNSSDKMPQHVLTSLAEARAAGRPHALLTLAVAGWCRALQGSDDAGRPLAYEDPLAGRLRRLARSGASDPARLVRGSGLFGALADDGAWVAELGAALRLLQREGVLGAVAETLRAPSLAAA